jgi:hypothetical protein
MAFYVKRRVNADAVVAGDTNQPDAEYRLTDDEYTRIEKMGSDYNGQVALASQLHTARTGSDPDANASFAPAGASASAVAGGGATANANDAGAGNAPQRSVPPSTPSGSATQAPTTREGTR